MFALACVSDRIALFCGKTPPTDGSMKTPWDASLGVMEMDAAGDGSAVQRDSVNGSGLVVPEWEN
jgi:hypothetical protein